MVKEFRLPNLGEQVESGELIKILVSVGDKITEDQLVLEMETDKAAFEVPSDVSGTIKEIHVKEGEQLKVGQLIFTLEDGDSGNEGSKGESKKEEAAKPPKEEGKKEDRKDKTAGEKKTAGPDKEGEKGSVEAKKAEEEHATPQAADSEDKSDRRVEEAFPGTEQGEESAGNRRDIAPAAPSVRRLARELGIDINEVEGTGPQGRISIDDVKNSVRRLLEEGPGREGAMPPLPDFAKWGGIERRPMSGVRRQTARNMSYSWSSIPHVTHFDEADITELDPLIQRYRKAVDEAGGRLTLTAIAVKIAASALGRFPQFKTSLDILNEEIIFKNYCHIGFAVATDRGLLVPVIRDADQKNISDISIELTQLAEKARSKKIKPEDMEGGVFTITNLGGIGGTQFSPIVYAPQVAILGISRSRVALRLHNHQPESRSLLPLSLSYDHRVIDGADAARFLRWVAEALEQPFFLSLNG